MDQGRAEEPLPKLFKGAFTKRDQETKARLHTLFNTAFYVASQNLAFSKFKGLCDLQGKNGLDFGTTRTIRHAGTLLKTLQLLRGSDPRRKLKMLDSCVLCRWLD